MNSTGLCNTSQKSPAALVYNSKETEVSETRACGGAGRRMMNMYVWDAEKIDRVWLLKDLGALCIMIRCLNVGNSENRMHEDSRGMRYYK